MRSERIPAFTLSSLPVCVPYFLSRFSSAAFCFQQPAHPLLPLFLSWHSLLPTSMSRERWSCKMGWLWWPWASRMNQASGLQWRGHLHRGCWTRLRQEPWCWFGRCPKALSCFFPAGAWLNHTWHSSKPSWLHADGLVCTGTSSASAVILEGMNQTAAGGIKLLGPFTEVRVLQTPCWGLCYSMIGCCCCLLERPNSSFGLRTNQPTNQPTWWHIRPDNLSRRRMWPPWWGPFNGNFDSSPAAVVGGMWRRKGGLRPSRPIPKGVLSSWP